VAFFLTIALDRGAWPGLKEATSGLTSLAMASTRTQCGFSLPDRPLELRKKLSQAMMGVVYEVYDPALGRTIALATIRLAVGTKGERKE
jgi:hypothetical protein